MCVTFTVGITFSVLITFSGDTDVFHLLLDSGSTHESKSFKRDQNRLAFAIGIFAKLAANA